MRISRGVVIAACVLLGWLGTAGTASASDGMRFDIAEYERVVQASKHNAEMQLIVNLVRISDGAHTYQAAGGRRSRLDRRRSASG